MKSLNKTNRASLKHEAKQRKAMHFLFVKRVKDNADSFRADGYFQQIKNASYGRFATKGLLKKGLKP